MEIKAGRLKHMVKVLKRMGDECVFEIEDGVIKSRVAKFDRSMMAKVSVRDDGIRVDRAHKVGVDLVKFGSFLNRADKNDVIGIEVMGGDDSEIEIWKMTRGVHEYELVMRNPKMVRGCIDYPDVGYDVHIPLSGKMFKDMVAYVENVGSEVDGGVALFQASVAEMIFMSRSVMTGGKYTAKLPLDMGGRSGTSMYGGDHLYDAAVDMVVADKVQLSFSTDFPCEIAYERDGVDVRFVVAPRIESD